MQDNNMDNICVCSLERLFNAFLEKTKISLPVLVTACALGYIWTARKYMKDMKKQCAILEDDVKQLDRGNFLLEEEIRHLKCTTSDTYLLSSDLNKVCVNNTQHKGKKYCASKCNLEMSLPNSPRCISRKMKVRKSRPHSPANDAELQIISYSTPDVCTKLPCRTPAPKCNNTELPPYVLCPQGETTKVSVNCKECDFLKPGRISFNQKCFEPNLMGHRIFKENRHSLKQPCCTPDPILEPFSCYRYIHKTKPKPQRNKAHDCKSDLIINCKNYTTDCGPCSKLKKSQCDGKNRNVDDPFSSCENPCNCGNQNNYDVYPQTVSKTKKLKDNIERYRSKLAKELGAFEKVSSCLLERKKTKLCDKAALDLKTYKNCGFFDNDFTL